MPPGPTTCGQCEPGQAVVIRPPYTISVCLWGDGLLSTGGERELSCDSGTPACDGRLAYAAEDDRAWMVCSWSQGRWALGAYLFWSGGVA